MIRRESTGGVKRGRGGEGGQGRVRTRRGVFGEEEEEDREGQRK